jgi:Tfp pilus assembly protein PilE
MAENWLEMLTYFIENFQLIVFGFTLVDLLSAVVVLPIKWSIT